MSLPLLRGMLLLACVLLPLGTPPTLASPQPPAATTATSSPVGSVAISFGVRNVNRTSVPCTSDGQAYRLRARLIGPEHLLHRPALPQVNLLVHDITAGRWFWTMPGHPAFNYARRLARLGEVSVAIDRLGYDASPHPAGTATCLAAQADMLHQVVRRLRLGRYASTAGHPAFGQVVLHGHSVGAAIAELEAATWSDVAGLVLMSWTDSGASPRAIQEAAIQSGTCLLGGEPATPGYAHYGRTPADFKALLFVTAPASLQERAATLRNPDPCGDVLSLAPVVVANNLLTRQIGVPVLLLFAEKDALNRGDARALQQLAYGPGARVEAHTVAGAGSALPLESSAPATRALVHGWLCRTWGCP